MAEGEVHKKKRSKNLAVLALILAWCALIWLVTMVRMAHGQEIAGMPPPAAGNEAAAGAVDYDLNKFFLGQRGSHQQDMMRGFESIMDRNVTHNAAMVESAERFRLRDVRHQKTMDAGFEAILERNRAHNAAIVDNDLKFRERGIAHREQMAPNPERWWQGWQDRLLPADYGNR